MNEVAEKFPAACVYNNTQFKQDLITLKYIVEYEVPANLTNPEDIFEVVNDRLQVKKFD